MFIVRITLVALVAMGSLASCDHEDDPQPNFKQIESVKFTENDLPPPPPPTGGG